MEGIVCNDGVHLALYDLGKSGKSWDNENHIRLHNCVVA